ncbi:MAG TPA: HPr family phosphocarrier protein [Chthoniobacterales bacterium]|jgi:phosphotransferase system HPr (HPr) family protein
MQRTKIAVQWTEGMPLRRAAKLMRIAQRFRSTVVLKFGGRIADVRSIVSIVTLCATMGAILDVEISGEDEKDAARAIEQAFADGAEAFGR